MLSHPLTSFETQKYYRNEPRFNSVCSRVNLLKIKDRFYVITLDEYYDIRIHRVALYVHNNYVAHFDSFGVNYIPKKIKAFIDRSLSIAENIFRIQSYDSIMCGYFCIGLIDFMLAGKTSTEVTNIFLRNNFKKNDDIILNYFMYNV